MTDRNETENERQSATLAYFFRHKIFKYIFMVVDDQRILEYLIVKVQNRLDQEGKKILKCLLSESDFYVYRQVKSFLENGKEGAGDGLIITGLNMLLYCHGAKAIELLNTSRDAFSRFRLPMVFVVNLENLKRIIKGAPDFYNMRDLPDLHFEGTWSPDTGLSAFSPRDYSQHVLTNIGLKISLLEAQLKKIKVKGKIDSDGLNNKVIPLLVLYLEQGNLKKMKSLYRRYIKGNEPIVKESEALERYRRITAKPGLAMPAGAFPGIPDEKVRKHIEAGIESRRHFIQEGEWDKAAEITFDLEEYLTLHGFPHRSVELLQELEGKKLEDKNRANIFHLIGKLYQGFGDYEAVLKQYEKAKETFEKIGDIKGVSAILHRIGNIQYLKGDYEAALKQYQKALEIFTKIGDIANAAMSMSQMGILHLKNNEGETALKYFIQAFQVFDKIGSPYAQQTKDYIARCREKLPGSRYREILQEFNLSPERFV